MGCRYSVDDCYGKWHRGADTVSMTVTVYGMGADTVSMAVTVYGIGVQIQCR